MLALRNDAGVTYIHRTSVYAHKQQQLTYRNCMLRFFRALHVVARGEANCQIVVLSRTL